MPEVFEARVYGADRISKRTREEAYTIDIGLWGREVEAEERVKFEAKRKAYRDGLIANSITVTPMY